MAEPQILRESVLIDGPTEHLVGELAYGDAATRGAVLLVGPHPFMGGTMDNNVIQHLGESLALAGYLTLRFNYRAIDNGMAARSMLQFWATGHAPQDPGLVDDASATAAWMRGQLAQPVTLVGYSFGAHAVAHISDQDTLGCVLIAPTVQQHDFAPLQHMHHPKRVIYSNNDFATTAVATESWYAQLPNPKSRRCVVGAEHFFKGHEAELASDIGDFLNGVATDRAGVHHSGTGGA